MLLGITFSPTADLARWADELGMSSHLLSDTQRSVGLAYGAAQSADQEKATRLSVLIGTDGRIEKVYASPDPVAHPAEVLAELAR